MGWRQAWTLKEDRLVEERKGKGVMVRTAWSLVLLRGHGAMGLLAPICPSLVFWYGAARSWHLFVRTDGAAC
jgi:DNA-binding FadR family transcriptional regulator